jgi:hypothetical protein
MKKSAGAAASEKKLPGMAPTGKTDRIEKNRLLLIKKSLKT